MKRIVPVILLALSAATAFCGDAAVFSDIGFSEDGLVYVFGQYGKLDQTYEAWAEIYTVDVARNDFVRNEVYRTGPSQETALLSGRKAWDALREQTAWKIGKYNCTRQERLLYVREGNRRSTDEIVFRDFDAPGGEAYYHVRVVPTFVGTGSAVQSKYYIQVEKRDASGSVLLSRQVGTPDFMRQGVTDYRIDRIFTDASGRSLVFIVEKTVQDATGTSIRYMVETARL